MASLTWKQTPRLKCWFIDTDTIQHNKDIWPFIAYCVTEIETVFHSLIFWKFLFIPPIVPNKKIMAKTKCFTVFYNLLPHMLYLEHCIFFYK